ncbi:hypothetical protein EUBHAL_01107 [Anaerobutyricum hallii DSM 3353]|uniref:Uncharacterized protein n=1 Tax=Anaerobutyricum hallii DSM 3353 TaxID=411469 RepID=C0EUM2_9FIRM|nr:hypothetical protein EUBHAL_01107 [Anaerobutyricum hallii DSM 3353]
MQKKYVMHCMTRISQQECPVFLNLIDFFNSKSKRECSYK